MSIAQELLSEFELQAGVTRKFLERLPDQHLTWQPHPKSMTAGQLAFHLAAVPGNVMHGAQLNQVPPPDFQFPQPESMKQVLETLEGSLAAVKEIMPSFSDSAMKDTWRIVAGDKELLAIPRQTFLRDIMLNHWYQHRGQFSVYLRLLDIAVPASWGPSADEPAPFEP